jgi:hypothetical protein
MGGFLDKFEKAVWSCPKDEILVRYTRGRRRKGLPEDLIVAKERLVGAVGIKPTSGDGTTFNSPFSRAETRVEYKK